MPLVLAPIEQDVEIIKILADEKLKKHLESLGLTVNSKLKVLQESNGNLICKVKEGRLALDKMTATKILIAIR
jgi:ferrous iron transport protein A